MTENAPAPATRRATTQVFHYTSAQGLLGTIQGRRIWASQASGLNDRAEVRQGWEKVRRWLADHPTDDSAVDLLRDLATSDPMNSEHEVFVLSGSTAGDDANQWRLYGNGGRGYVIEFDPARDLIPVSTVDASVIKSKSMSKGILPADIVTISPWLHVLYADAEIEAALKEVVVQVNADLARLSATHGLSEDEYSIQYHEIEADAYAGLAQVAHLVKAPGFSGENEVRIVTTYLWANRHVHYRQGAYGIVAYGELAARPDRHSSSRVMLHPVDGPAHDQLPVVSVRLGPLLPDDHKETVQAFLKRSGLGGAAVLTSDVPLR